MGAILNIPNGPANVSQIFPAININDVDEYYIQVLDGDNMPLATTTINKMMSCDDSVRIHFINSFGCVDGITMHLSVVKHISKSESFKTPISTPVVKSRHNNNRFNVVAQDVFTVKTMFYGENEMRWLDELFDSPLAWVENGSPNELIPIIIIDSDREKVKELDAYNYEVTLEYTLSHDKIIIKN
ncbi:hypothetical protein ACLOAU_14640 [Niabella sp. CJ426]|uniref:hypothetical protein n=1 Tax=Niabella sp. CJ426 TaxID=3393740 RepID=UPI003CFF8FE6